MNSEQESHLSCVFCRELDGSRDTNFAKRYPEISTRIVGESESLVAFPCIGQLSPGHFLVVPKHHDATFRDTKARVGDLQTQFQTVIRHVHMLVDADVHDSLYFEHGARVPDEGGCGIYHAHIHVVPNAGHLDLARHFPTEGSSRSRSVHEALAAVGSNLPYLLFGSASVGFYSRSLASALPSQTLRRLVAEHLKADAWDWRATDREAGMMSMLQAAGSL